MDGFKNFDKIIQNFRLLAQQHQRQLQEEISGIK